LSARDIGPGGEPVSDWLPDDSTEWGGRPVARRVADAGPRQCAVLTGAILAVTPRHAVRGSGAGCALDACLDDGTGEITLRWLGRGAIAGVVAGARMKVQGTVQSSTGAGLVVLNPMYRFVGDDPSAGAGAVAGRGAAQAESSTS
jgi:hypothetical protein